MNSYLPTGPYTCLSILASCDRYSQGKPTLLFMQEMRLAKERVRQDLLSFLLDEFGCYTKILYEVLLKVRISLMRLGTL